ncbi:MAG: YdcF family protein [Acidobacteria bacterium]|nr:YdcF family protein [Acidobacteriota bacterium]
MPRHARRRWLLAAALLVLLLAIFTSESWLGWFGQYLVQAEAPEKADTVLVLAGDSSGNRILKGAELIRQGWASFAVISGSMSLYGHDEANAAVALAVQNGYPASYFRPMQIEANSTREEAAILWKYLQSQGVRKFLVVTSDMHTRRAGRVYRQVARSAEIRMVAAPTPRFDPASWWKTRPARKLVFNEWIKTIADWLGI